MYFSLTKITHLIATFLFIFFLFFSCRNNSGDQCFDNCTNEPIDLYIDGFYEITIDEGDENCIFLGEGCWDWYAEGVISGDYTEGVVCLNSAGGFGATITIE